MRIVWRPTQRSLRPTWRPRPTGWVTLLYTVHPWIKKMGPTLTLITQPQGLIFFASRHCFNRFLSTFTFPISLFFLCPTSSLEMKTESWDLSSSLCAWWRLKSVPYFRIGVSSIEQSLRTLLSLPIGCFYLKQGYLVIFHVSCNDSNTDISLFLYLIVDSI